MILRITLTILYIPHTLARIQFYILDLLTGDALTCSTAKCHFAPQTYDNKEQLWNFNADYSLHVDTGEGLSYEAEKHRLFLIPATTTTKPEWRLVESQFRGIFSGNKTEVCLSNPKQIPNYCTGDSAASGCGLIVGCDSANAANLTLLIHDSQLFFEIRTVVQSQFQILDRNISDLQKAVNETEKHMNDTNENIFVAIGQINGAEDGFYAEARKQKNNMTLELDHMEDNIMKIEDNIEPLTEYLDNLTAVVNGTSYNFTRLYDTLYNSTNSTNTTMMEILNRMQEEIDNKASKGRIAPSNIYDFLVILLCGMGIANVVDIFIRVFNYAISQVNPQIQYGTN